MARLQNKELLIFANYVLLPFSYLNIIQRYRSISQDRERSAFFVEDYCKIDGANNLHKCKYDPALLEKIIDCYWNQNAIYVFSVLVNEEPEGNELSRSANFKGASLRDRERRMNYLR